MRLSWTARQGLRWIGRLWPETWQLSGEERHTGLPLTVLCATRAPNRSYLVKMLFAPGCRQEPLGRICLANLLRTSTKSACPLLLAEVHHTQCRLLCLAGETYFIPVWVEGVVDLAAMAYRSSHSLQQDLRLSRVHRLEVTVTQDPVWLDRFYNEMYLPTVTKAHGSSAEPRPLGELRTAFARGDLLLVCNPTGCLGGLLLGYEPESPRIHCVGVLGGDRDHLRHGAVSALYDFAFRRLEQGGYTKVRLGLSRAFLNDGVTRYKKKFAQTIVRPSGWRFVLSVIEPSPAATAVLRNNPFLHVTTDGLSAATFLEAALLRSSPQTSGTDRCNRSCTWTA
jgi:hypothetical protein